MDAMSCEREVRELHRFFEVWFEGAMPNDEAGFGRLSRALASDFLMVSPRGVSEGRKEVLAAVRSAWGRRAMKISIERVRLVALRPPLAVVSYEEWQEQGGHRSGRISTAVFRESPEGPLGFQWIHLHETWLVPPSE